MEEYYLVVGTWNSLFCCQLFDYYIALEYKVSDQKSV
jgi:hypothetical protein